MKTILVLFTYLVLAVILGWGIFNAAKGSFGPLAISVVAFLGAFAKFGCCPPSEH